MTDTPPNPGMPKRGWLTDEQQQIWRNWLLAKTRMEDYLDHALAEFDLSLDEYELLVRLSESEGYTLRMGELADMVRHSRSRLTHTVARMEKRGLVVRRKCAADGRGVEAALTEAGMHLLVTAAPVHVDSVREVFVDAISPAEFATLGRCMEQVLAVADVALNNR